MTKREIEVFAKQTLNDHGIQGIPVDPVILANKLGIKVSNAVFSDASLSGMIAKRGASTTLLVNDNDSINRKRFTIAHELGHLLLHLHTGNDGEFVDSEVDFFRTESSDGVKIHEVEANQFAAALLMDADLVKKYWNEFKNLETLCEIFQVSESAMGIRLSSLGVDVNGK